MREVRGVPARDTVIDRKTNQSAKAGDIKKKVASFHREEAETAREELRLLKEKLGIAGIDIDGLPDVLPGAEIEKLGNSGSGSNSSGSSTGNGGAGSKAGQQKIDGKDLQTKAGR